MEIKARDYIRFGILSLIGIFLFFVPVDGSAVPIVVMTNTIKAFCGHNIIYVVVGSCTLLMITLILGKCFKIERFQNYHANEHPIKIGIFIATFIVIGGILLEVPIEPLRHPEIGGKVLGLASTVMTTIICAGWLVIFILNSGIVESVAILVEPIMRPFYKLPGEAAVNCISSFVSSASVGVYFTDQYYQNKTYTQKEATVVATTFSVISVGYIGVLASIAGIEEYYGCLIICAFILIMVMGAICVSIPPLSRKPECYVDGTKQTQEQKQVTPLGFQERLKLAVRTGAKVSRSFTLKAFWRSLWEAMKFAQKIVAVMITSVVIVLTVAYYTPLFTWLGQPFIPIYTILGLPDAAQIAPATMLGIVEVSLPSISISALNVAPQSAFFTVLLSIVQIIFMTEAGNAMLSSSIGITVKDLLLVFLTRTAIAIPLVALCTHIIF